MIKIGEKMYYIDMGKIEELVGVEHIDDMITETSTTTHSEFGDNDIIPKSSDVTVIERKRDTELNTPKYETVMMMLNVVLGQPLELDAPLGVTNALRNGPINYTLAFNTLLFYNIIREL